MDFNRHISRRLHEEHVAQLALWARLEQALVARGRAWPPTDGETLGLLRAAGAALSDEVSRHFDFEERELFPRMADAGESDIAGLLREEHETLRGAAREFAVLIAFDTLGVDGWKRLRILTLEVCERLVAHVQKEEMSLLPALDDLLDEATDGELLAAYAASG